MSRLLPIFDQEHPRHAQDIKTVRDAVIAFYDKHGDYPTSRQFEDLSSTMRGITPCIRRIQSRGGIRWFFEDILKLSYVDGRSREARNTTGILTRASENEKTFYQQLTEIFGEDKVHRQSPYDSNTSSLHRSDFLVFGTKYGRVFFDTFFPMDMYSLTGCVNIKIKKLQSIDVSKKYPILLVSFNEETVRDFTIRDYLESRRKPFPRPLQLHTRTSALEWCKSVL